MIDGDVAAYAEAGRDLAWLEVAGAQTSTGDYETAAVRWPGGQVDVTGRVVSTIRLGMDETHVGLTTPGDGDAIVPAFVLIERASGRTAFKASPPHRVHELAGNASGRWLLQDVPVDAPSRFDAWIEHGTGPLAARVE